MKINKFKNQSGQKETEKCKQGREKNEDFCWKLNQITSVKRKKKKQFLKHNGNFTQVRLKLSHEFIGFIVTLIVPIPIYKTTNIYI